MGQTNRRTPPHYSASRQVTYVYGLFGFEVFYGTPTQ